MRILRRDWLLSAVILAIHLELMATSSSSREHDHGRLPSNSRFLSVVGGRRGGGAVEMAGEDWQAAARTARQAGAGGGRRQAYSLSLSPETSCPGGKVRISWSANPRIDFSVSLWRASSSSGERVGTAAVEPFLVEEPHEATGQREMVLPYDLSGSQNVVACMWTMDGLETTCSQAIAVGQDLVGDVCGICGGDGTSCQGCDGVPNSGLRHDVCGICGGDGTSCVGCDGVPNSGKVYNSCGLCGGDDSTCVDCMGVINGGAREDACGLCGGDNSTCTDCRGVLMGSASFDLCGVCDGDSTTCLGCDPANPGKQVDSCGVCGGNDASCGESTGLHVPGEVCGGAQSMIVRWTITKGMSNSSVGYNLCLFKEPYVLPYQVSQISEALPFHLSSARLSDESNETLSNQVRSHTTPHFLSSSEDHSSTSSLRIQGLGFGV